MHIPSQPSASIPAILLPSQATHTERLAPGLEVSAWVLVKEDRVVSLETNLVPS